MTRFLALLLALTCGLPTLGHSQSYPKCSSPRDEVWQVQCSADSPKFQVAERQSECERKKQSKCKIPLAEQAAGAVSITPTPLLAGAEASRFETEDIGPGDVYATYEVAFDLIKRPQHCESADMSRTFARSLFGRQSAEEVSISLVIAEESIVFDDKATSTKGLVFPIFHFSRTEANGCESVLRGRSSFTAARLLAERSSRFYTYLRVSSASAESVLKYQTDVAQIDFGIIQSLATVANGAFGTYAPILGSAISTLSDSQSFAEELWEIELRTYPTREETTIGVQYSVKIQGEEFATITIKPYFSEHGDIEALAWDDVEDLPSLERVLRQVPILVKSPANNDQVIKSDLLAHLQREDRLPDWDIMKTDLYGQLLKKACTQIFKETEKLGISSQSARTILGALYSEALNRASADQRDDVEQIVATLYDTDARVDCY